MIEDLKSKPLEVTLRVRFAETDAMGVVWHGNYFQYLEAGRVEWLRSAGLMDDLQAQRLRMAVVHATVDYQRPARFDDLLSVRTTLVQCTQVRLSFQHEILRQEEVLVTGRMDVACLDSEGRLRRFPQSYFHSKN